MVEFIIFLHGCPVGEVVAIIGTVIEHSLLVEMPSTVNFSSSTELLILHCFQVALTCSHHAEACLLYFVVTNLTESI